MKEKGFDGTSLCSMCSHTAAQHHTHDDSCLVEGCECDSIGINQRPETQPMEFEGDWTGIFIRGDQALLQFAPALRWAIEQLKEAGINFTDSPTAMFHHYALARLEKLLMDADQHKVKDGATWPTQMMKPFKDCLV